MSLFIEFSVNFYWKNNKNEHSELSLQSETFCSTLVSSKIWVGFCSFVSNDWNNNWYHLLPPSHQPCQCNATAYKLIFECQLLLIKVDIAWVIENKTFLSIPGQHSIRITIIHVIGDVHLSWTKSNLTYEMLFLLSLWCQLLLKFLGNAMRFLSESSQNHF